MPGSPYLAPPPVSAVPRRLRLVCAVAAGVVVVAMLVVGLLLKQSSTGVVAFGTGDQVAIIGLGLAIGAGILALGRPRVDADADGVRVRNVVTRHDLPWQAVRAIAFPPSSPWVTLLLSDGDELAVLAVQAADKERAVAAVEGLRALHAASRQNAGSASPPRGE
jgi:hypothetical protein